MKKTILLSEGIGYTAVNVGTFDKLFEHALIHPKTQETIEGKVFLRDSTKATGSEISINAIPPKREVPYFHSHRENEETYIILKGFGDFQVGDDCFPISEGSAIRVATGVSRGLRNGSDEQMTYMVIQSKEKSLGNYSVGDGYHTEFNPKWDK